MLWGCSVASGTLFIPTSIAMKLRFFSLMPAIVFIPNQTAERLLSDNFFLFRLRILALHAVMVCGT